jgi:hypothetical protein
MFQAPADKSSFLAIGIGNRGNQLRQPLLAPVELWLEGAEKTAECRSDDRGGLREGRTIWGQFGKR